MVLLLEGRGSAAELADLMALSWLMNMGFAGGGGAVAAASAGGERPQRVISRQRPYTYGYRYIVKGVQWTLSIFS